MLVCANRTMTDTIANVRRPQSTMHGHLTCIERDTSSLEDKKLTPSDQRKINHLKDQVKEHNKDFEKHQIKVLNVIE